VSPGVWNFLFNAKCQLGGVWLQPVLASYSLSFFLKIKIKKTCWIGFLKYLKIVG
jgi:hypothetical protein